MDSSDGYTLEPTTLPVDDGQVVRVHRPFKRVLLGLELLQLHRQPPLVDLPLGKDTEMARQTKFIANRDKPFGWVPLVPLRSVPVVHWELMVEVMVAFPKRYKCRNQMISWRVFVIECAFAQPMC